jgi:flagellar hook-associated protein 1 FlgK
MSLTNALNNAVSGLNVSQASLALVSQNIANANNENYARKVAIQESVVAGDERAGVKIAEVRRYVDQYLRREILSTSSDWGRFDAQLTFLDRLQNTFGQPGSDTTITSRLDRVFSAFENVGTMADNSAARAEVVFALESLTREVEQIHNEVQTLRRDIDTQIAQEIQQVNESLLRIENLNNKVALALVGTGDASEFLDLRDAELAKIAERISINTYTQSDGRIVILAGSGTMLLDQEAWVLDYQSAALVEPGTVFSDITVRRQTATAGTGAVMTRDVTTGRVRGLMDLRDDTLEGTATSLGEFSARLADEFNRIHNDNIGFPPPNSLTGSHNTGLAVTDPTNFTGIVTFSVIDPAAPTTNGYGVVRTVTVDFDASTLTPDFGAPVVDAMTTIQELIAVVNGPDGLNGTATMAMTNGVLSLTATNSTHGVGIIQDATTPSDRGGRGFSHFFGLNDLMTATSPTFFDLGVAAGDTHQFTGNTDFTVRNANGAIVASTTFTPVGGDFTSLVTQLNTALTGYATFALDATTGRITLTEGSGYTLLVKDQGPPSASDRASTGMGMATLLGFGDDKTQRVSSNLAVNSQIVADTNRLGLAKLQGAALNDPGATPGDARGAQALAALTSTDITINAAGNLSARNSTLSTYAGSVISDAAIRTSAVTGQAEEFDVLYNTLKNKSDSITGVNVDEELSKMIVLQNAYSASARLISTVTAMFDELLSIST